jgi:hypothetical protein
MKTVTALAAGLALLGAHAHAQGVAVGVKVGTPGLGIELIKSVAGGANLRLASNLLGNYTYTGEESGVSYDLELRPRSGAGIVDFHPGGNAFRLSAGLLYNKTKISGRAHTAGTYTIGGSSYTGAELGTLTARIQLGRTLAPYLGIGLGNAVGRGKRITLSLDLGVVLQGSPTTELTTTGPIATDAHFQSELAREKSEVDEDLKKGYYKYYPVVAVGVAFRL